MMLDEPRTQEEMHARYVAAQRRMYAAARSTISPRQSMPAKPKPAPRTPPLPIAGQRAKPAMVVQAERLEALRVAVAALVERNPDRWKAREILAIAAVAGDITIGALTSLRRDNDVVRPRQVAAWLIRRFTGLSTTLIGNAIGQRDHTTVLHAMARVEVVVAEIGSPQTDTPKAWADAILAIVPWPPLVKLPKR